jgi:predicted enzyme related to lactoylglutathione lyase
VGGAFVPSSALPAYITVKEACMGRVIHFEIGAEDPLRAKRFYEEALGWEIQDASQPGIEYFLVMTQGKGWEAKRGANEPGIDGGIFRRQDKAKAPQGTANAFVCTVEVADIDGSIAKVHAAGGGTVGEKLEIPGVGILIYATDTEGNQFSMLQPAPQPGR